MSRSNHCGMQRKGDLRLLLEGGGGMYRVGNKATEKEG